MRASLTFSLPLNFSFRDLISAFRASFLAISLCSRGEKFFEPCSRGMVFDSLLVPELYLLFYHRFFHRLRPQCIRPVTLKFLGACPQEPLTPAYHAYTVCLKGSCPVGGVDLSYCSGCGSPLGEGVRFCAFCGAAASIPETRPAVPPDARGPGPASVAVAVEARRAGFLAIKAFAFAFLLEVVFMAAGGGGVLAHVVAISAFGIGATYVIVSLRAWRKSGANVKGSTVAWLMVSFMLLVCLGNLMSLVGGSGNAYRPSPAASATQSPAPSGAEDRYEERIRPDPKTFLLQSLSLDFNWRKEAFGDVMIADFTLHNPTQYRFKDFEITCTHSAPSGTVIDSNTRTIYEMVEPTSLKKVRNMNMGFINSQATRSGCRITDLVVLP
jgi:hypothetical protein